MVTDQLGFDAEPRIRSTQEVATAVQWHDDLIVPIGPTDRIARRFRWRGDHRRPPVVTAAVNWLMCEVELDPPWIQAPEVGALRWRSPGDPDVLVTFKGLRPGIGGAGLLRNPGVVATANHCVSAIPYVCRAGRASKRTWTYRSSPAGRPCDQRVPAALGRPRYPGLTRSRTCAFWVKSPVGNSSPVCSPKAVAAVRDPAATGRLVRASSGSPVATGRLREDHLVSRRPLRDIQGRRAADVDR